MVGDSVILMTHKMSGSQMMKNKEDVAAIMKAKQQAGEFSVLMI